ncbi:MAG: nucleotidyltransferase [Thaumarchaeota archaeon]|nr:nucleotidyltransferase [Nitrososphaerota archaeon]
MSQHADLTARETEVIRILRVLHSHSGKLVVIGGYAVSALAAHRFSVDCDIVVPEKEMRPLEGILVEEGYVRTKATDLQKGIHGARTVRYVRLIGGKRVAVDLYTNSVLSRDTAGEWSYDKMIENSLETNIVGVTDSTMARVPKKELLIAMKLHAARDTDIRDIVMLGEGANWNAVADFADTGTRRKLIAQLDSGIRQIGSRGFLSSFKAEFGLRTDMVPQIKLTLKRLKTVKGLLDGN